MKSTLQTTENTFSNQVAHANSILFCLKYRNLIYPRLHFSKETCPQFLEFPAIPSSKLQTAQSDRRRKSSTVKFLLRNVHYHIDLRHSAIEFQKMSGNLCELPANLKSFFFLNKRTIIGFSHQHSFPCHRVYQDICATSMEAGVRAVSRTSDTHFLKTTDAVEAE